MNRRDLSTAGAALIKAAPKTAGRQKTKIFVNNRLEGKALQTCLVIPTSYPREAQTQGRHKGARCNVRPTHLLGAFSVDLNTPGVVQRFRSNTGRTKALLNLHLARL